MMHFTLWLLYVLVVIVHDLLDGRGNLLGSQISGIHVSDNFVSHLRVSFLRQTIQFCDKPLPICR